MCPSKVAEGEERGYIIPIGGAEDRESRRRILKRFVQICGGRDRRHRDHPDGYGCPTTEEVEERRPLGRARHVARLDSRGDARTPHHCAAYRGSGGSHRRQPAEQLPDHRLTSMARIIRDQCRRMPSPEPVQGTASERALSRWKEGSLRAAEECPGPGWAPQSFSPPAIRQPDRPRPWCGTGYNPFAIGIGLDEDTAAFTAPTTRSRSRQCWVTIVEDGGSLSSMARRAGPNGLHAGVTMHPGRGASSTATRCASKGTWLRKQLTTTGVSGILTGPLCRASRHAHFRASASARPRRLEAWPKASSCGSSTECGALRGCRTRCLVAEPWLRARLRGGRPWRGTSRTRGDRLQNVAGEYVTFGKTYHLRRSYG